jgi:hypothetical protein
VVEPTRIEEVKDRVRAFAQALRQAGAEDVAQRIEGYSTGFVDSTQVRRSVDAIKQELQYFRAYPDELPALPVVQIAANRLEDVCIDALRAGLIAPARPSLRAASKRKLGLITATLSAAGLGLLVPLTVIMFGVDLTDLHARRTLPPVRLAQGDQTSLQVNALEPSARPADTRAVEFYVLDRCPHELPLAQNCRALGPRQFGTDNLASYEIVPEGQAYGLFVAFAPGRMIGAVGTGRVLLEATADTPEGRYELPLRAAFSGYTPERCDLLLRLQKRCEPARLGPHEQHEDVPVPTLIIDVVRGAPGGNSQSAQRKAADEAEQRRRAEQRAAQIAGAVAEIKAVLDDTQAMLRRKRYDGARERIDKLAQLFAPLDALVVTGSEAEPLPPEVTGLRARFEIERRELAGFQDRAFDAAYAALSRPRTQHATDDIVLAAVARKLGITSAFLDIIYADHAEQLEALLSSSEQARLAKERAATEAVLRRCGPLPTGTWREVQAYLSAMANSVRVKTRLNECFTPRLTEHGCWSVVCDFAEIIPQDDVAPDVIKAHKWTFNMQKGRVIDHVERVVDGP